MQKPIYSMAMQLGAEPGWNMTRVILEIGVTRPTFYRIIKDISLCPRPRYEFSIKLRNLYHKFFPSPLGEFQKIIDSIHDGQDTFKDDGYYEDYLKNELIRAQSQKPPENSVALMQNCYVEALAVYQLKYVVRASGYVDRPVDDVARKFMQAHEGFTLLGKEYEDLAARCKMSSLVMQFMALDKKTRGENEGIKAKFRDENFYGAADIILNADRHFWKAARNGLVCASQLKDHMRCIYFRVKLNEAHKNFIDLYYAPPGLPSIMDDPDLIWYRENVLYV